MASATPDVRLPSQPQGIPPIGWVPNYTAWWQRHMRVSNLPMAALDSNVYMCYIQPWPTCNRKNDGRLWRVGTVCWPHSARSTNIWSSFVRHILPVSNVLFRTLSPLQEIRHHLIDFIKMKCSACHIYLLNTI